ncbi:uncharacterized protein LOC133194446 [Saccostrea echinata]|uniref:uncharacterized protein LOC133194446 n=1 Tax=Saccostrea echinata TaxID=191078 RepID=UPI002A80712F|nr:uncharacterized protein LOC133194446 [Saccostrea echinata]XP_061186386.1 uncharacterized protein LOC133194446 [Saccostrea echinata]
MSDCGDMDGCDCDCGDDCCDSGCFSCDDDGCCGSDGTCCGDDHVHGNDNVSVDGSRHGGGCNWCICFLVSEDDSCCDSEDRRRRRNQRRYELERRRHMEVKGQNTMNLPSAADGVNPADPAYSTLHTVDQEPETPQPSETENISPAAITAQPPSYDEVIHKDTVVTSQPV